MLQIHQVDDDEMLVEVADLFLLTIVPMVITLQVSTIGIVGML